MNTATEKETAVKNAIILISDPLSEEGLQPLREAEGVELKIQTGMTPEELVKAVKEADALLVRSQTQVTREVIEAAGNLKVIGRAGVGVDNIDLEAATERGIIVVNAPDGNTNSAAEHTIAMMTALARNIPQAFLSLKEGKWDRKKFVGVELKEKTLGIVGLGRIGAEVARRAKGQRMSVIAYDPFLTQERAKEMGIAVGTLDEVVAAADFITVHTPLMKETRHLINADRFAKMKDGVRIINCARGGIIDEDALYDAIESGKVAGAALDVFETEPFTGHRLLDLPQVIATPHLGASTIEAQESVAIDVGRDVVRFFDGQPVRNPVNMPSVSREVLAKIGPFFDLAEDLGVFISHLADKPLTEVNIRYAGDLAEFDVRPLTRNALKGILKRNLGTHVNDVNAKYLADSIGIGVTEHKSAQTKGFQHLITVEVKTGDETHSVSGTLLNGLGERIVKVDDYVVDVVPAGHLLLIKHKDQPGAIGRVGTLLAEENINIATMQVGRSAEGGDAIMMITVDNEVKPEEVSRLLKIEDIHAVRTIDL
ncbi:phosphoglycerate dehydrogenase [Bhargavaea beijingensis]|uniref:D-3-phosphoglycerate dehydrogenase n=1 Tax=Bhargavaea beijingensis TaxID=426756 RepID=A0A1G7B904_9BACL|nr:phosphoglycerate dehydrogenase [Bhargavaea beijingensis]MCW1928401.1 phosphoglycerate dehydrogenase [Bhargavaea beijingensis]RSK32639.1 phosphoglycerate dehydrogenase [Bhargavaea beijingensis]SDE23493.1 D-3-phosphoglycerate dehydrogenase [Bhargavaea beijingensis]